MKADEFIKTVMDVAGLPSREDAENAIRATLETLSEHLAGGEPGNLAAQLPPEIATYLNQPYVPHQQSFGLQQFFNRVAQREGVSYSQAEGDASAVLQVISVSVTPGLIQNVQSQLPPDMKSLFDVPIAQPHMQSTTNQTSQASENQQAFTQQQASASQQTTADQATTGNEQIPGFHFQQAPANPSTTGNQSAS